MSNIQYGLISRVDSDCIEKTLDLIIKDFPNEVLNYTEVGLYNGRTTSGVNEYLKTKNVEYSLIGIDNFKDKEELVFYPENAKLIQGSSIEVYNQLPDESQYLIFIDGLHTFSGVVSDFFCYAPKVRIGGFLAFHDCGKHIDPLSGWQGVGDKNDPDMCLGGVRKALREIGLFGDWITQPSQSAQYYPPTFKGWQLIFDEADPLDSGGGICVFKKLY